MGILLAVIQLAVVPILLAVALAVRCARAARPLNGVDYTRVRDPAALHRWAGNRLLVLPAAFLAGGLASLQWTALAPVFLAVAVIACLAAGIRVAAGAERFQSAA